MIAVCGTVGLQVEERSDVVRAARILGAAPISGPDSKALRAPFALLHVRS
jgi:hypothetical protein